MRRYLKLDRCNKKKSAILFLSTMLVTINIKEKLSTLFKTLHIVIIATYKMLIQIRKLLMCVLLLLLNVWRRLGKFPNCNEITYEINF